MSDEVIDAFTQALKRVVWPTFIPLRLPHHRQDLSAKLNRATGPALIETPPVGKSSTSSSESCPRADGPGGVVTQVC